MALVRLLGIGVLLAGSKCSALRAVDSRGSEEGAANPIRKVVGLLQAMAKKVEKEGQKEKDLYEKFMCYCKNGAADLNLAISDSSAKVPSLQSDIEAAEANSVKLKQDLKQHQTNRAAAKAAMAEATSLREKDNAAYVAESTELKGYVNALAGAIPAIEAGMAGTGLLQTQAATVAQLRRAASRDDTLTDYDRESILSFLAGNAKGSSSRYVPKGGEIVGILKEMKKNFDSDLAGVEEKEAEALKVYEELIAAKEKEVNSHTGSIEKKTARVGELDMSIVRMKQELTENEAALIENQKFLKDLDSDCAAKTGEMEERVKTRAEELVAIHETIKILNDDDALELFKKTLPSASFVQLGSGKKTDAKRKAMLLLRKIVHTPKDTGSDLRFLELALMGRKVDFTKVFKMIDDMITILKQEQVDDEAKKEYCNMQIDQGEDKSKELTGTIHDLEVNIEEKTGAISTLKDELKTFNAGVAELDKQVAEATEQRKDENKEFTELMSDDTAAKELLNFAKNRLQKFYNPKLYKPPPKAEDAAEEFVQVASSHHSGRQEPGPSPATWSQGYGKKGEENAGVIQMIDLLIRDLDKEITEAQTQEEMSQKAYEELMNDSAEKRAKDVKAIQVKQSAVADNEELLTTANGDLKAKKQEFMAVETYVSQLHGECDWLLQNFDLRKSARAEEMDALKQAKAVLAGADFSFVQASKAPLISRQRSH
jgi:septal ring factor EnvC (AmiA/AmiB activator)